MEYSLPVVGWRLWYGDGSVASSVDTSWDDAPDQDVQVLEVLHPAPYRTLTYGVDEYRLPGTVSVKFGAWMDEQEFYALVTRVTNG